MQLNCPFSTTGQKQLLVGGRSLNFFVLSFFLKKFVLFSLFWLLIAKVFDIALKNYKNWKVEKKKITKLKWKNKTLGFLIFEFSVKNKNKNKINSKKKKKHFSKDGWLLNVFSTFHYVTISLVDLFKKTQNYYNLFFTLFLFIFVCFSFQKYFCKFKKK